MYKPLPSSLVIQSSSINGQGLFAKQNIPARENLGVTHIKLGEKIIRTPLGGFINHSDKPNCIKEENRFTHNLFLKTIKNIKEGEELTLNYTLYKIK